MEEEKAVEKAKKTNNSSRKASILEVEILESSSILLLDVIWKRDAHFASLFACRIQVSSFPAFKEVAIEDVVDKSIYPSLLMTINAYYTQHKVFLSGW